MRARARPRFSAPQSPPRVPSPPRADVRTSPLVLSLGFLRRYSSSSRESVARLRDGRRRRVAFAAKSRASNSTPRADLSARELFRRALRRELRFRRRRNAASRLFSRLRRPPPPTAPPRRRARPAPNARDPRDVDPPPVPPARARTESRPPRARAPPRPARVPTRASARVAPPPTRPRRCAAAATPPLDARVQLAARARSSPPPSRAPGFPFWSSPGRVPSPRAPRTRRLAPRFPLVSADGGSCRPPVPRANQFLLSRGVAFELVAARWSRRARGTRAGRARRRVRRRRLGSVAAGGCRYTDSYTSALCFCSRASASPPRFPPRAPHPPARRSQPPPRASRAVGLGLGDVRVGGPAGTRVRLRQSSGQALGARGAVAHRGVKRAVLLRLRDPGVDRAVGEERVEGLVGTETVGRTAGQSSREGEAEGARRMRETGDARRKGARGRVGKRTLKASLVSTSSSVEALAPTSGSTRVRRGVRWWSSSRRPDAPKPAPIRK